jgi:hypothetical protein
MLHYPLLEGVRHTDVGHVSSDATLVDMEDDEVTDHESGTRIVQFGQFETEIVDMESDESWPDRAHVEITLTNF